MSEEAGRLPATPDELRAVLAAIGATPAAAATRAPNGPLACGAKIKGRCIDSDDFLVPLLVSAQAGHALLQLSLRGIECVAEHDVHVVVAVALRALHVDDDILARHGELHLDGEDLALVVVPVRRIEHDAATLDAITEGAEVIRELANPRLDGGG